MLRKKVEEILEAIPELAQRKIKKIEQDKHGGLQLMPPKKDVCQECATKHKPDEPHNQESLYYQMQFRMDHGRFPTWDDAMAHCDEKTKDIWREEREKAGAMPTKVSKKGN